MLNGSIFGQRFYAAGNPSWTVHKPKMSIRANGQVKGILGHGAQQFIRRAFAEYMIQNAFGQTGFALVNGKMTPRPANIAQQGLANAYRRFPQIAVGPEARRQKMITLRQEAHAANVAKWQTASAPAAGFAPQMPFTGGY